VKSSAVIKYNGSQTIEVSGSLPAYLPLGFRTKSINVDLAAMLSRDTFFDPNSREVATTLENAYTYDSETTFYSVYGYDPYQ
jgi:hypothetical protein